MLIIKHWRQNRKIIKRDRKLKKESIRDHARIELYTGLITNLASILGIGTALFLTPVVQHYLLLQLGCYIALSGVGIRVCFYGDIFATQRMRKGSKHWFPRTLESLFRNTPLRYFSNIRLITLEIRKNHLDFIKSLQEKREREPENREVIDKDITAFNVISGFLNPYTNLKTGTLGGLGLGVSLTRFLTEFAHFYKVQFAGRLIGQLAGIGLSATFCAAQFGVYTTKRLAAGDRSYDMHPIHKFLLGRMHTFVMKTPIRYLSWWLLNRGYKKVRKLTISPFLSEYLDKVGISPQLKIFDKALSSPRALATITLSERLRVMTATSFPQTLSNPEQPVPDGGVVVTNNTNPETVDIRVRNETTTTIPTTPHRPRWPRIWNRAPNDRTPR